MTAPSIVLVSPDELRTLVCEAVRAELAAHSSTAPASPLVDRHELARVLGCSPATIARLTREGMPCTYVGASPRFNGDAARAWLVERGRQGTRAAPPRATVMGVRLLSRRTG